MSVSATVWAWGVEGISGTQKLVLLSLADRAGENHECWPSMSRLVSNTGLTKNTIRKAIADMCAAGLIKKEERHNGGRQTSNNYTLQVRGCEITPPEGCEIGRGEGCEIGTQNLPEEPIITNPLYNPPGLNVTAWGEYIAYRKESKTKKLTASGERKAIDKLIAMGDFEYQQKVIDQTMANGWAGLFELKGQNNGTHQQSTTSRAKRVSDELDRIAREDIEQNGLPDFLG